ncbi:hypothetical protein K466DRAFT_448070, partial [Polyporus arcularius HHB13444]
VLKPREPTQYDGSPDAQAFHKFVQEMTDYVDGYQLDSSRHAATVGHFLTGNAYKFYANTVAFSPKTWSLRDVFVELFNYCFPVDFRQQTKKQLRKARQGDRSVKDYVQELTGLFLMVGFVPEENRVEKLWYGLKPQIQAELWRAHLNPSTSSWSAV